MCDYRFLVYCNDNRGFKIDTIMTLNDLIKKSTQLSRRYSSGDVPLTIDGHPVDIVLQDITDEQGIRIAVTIQKHTQELQELCIRRAVCINIDYVHTLNALHKQGVISVLDYNTGDQRISVVLNNGTNGETDDWLVLDKKYQWRILTKTTYLELLNNNKIIMI